MDGRIYGRIVNPTRIHSRGCRGLFGRYAGTESRLERAVGAGPETEESAVNCDRSNSSARYYAERVSADQNKSLRFLIPPLRSAADSPDSKAAEMRAAIRCTPTACAIRRATSS
jgi:hypothetical protein